jgi:hypothetical protein
MPSILQSKKRAFGLKLLELKDLDSYESETIRDFKKV